MSVVRQALDRLRGARHIGWLALTAAAAAIILLLTGSGETADSGATALEKRMESVLCCVEGAGRVRVLVNGGEPALGSGQSAGVLVVAEGARDIRVRMELEQAVMALLDIDASQIEILGMKGEDES